MTIQNTAANGGQILTDERIVELYRESFSAMVGRLREAPKSVPDTVTTFARGIEADLRTTLASQPVLSKPVDMILHCPLCGLHHIDGTEFAHRNDLAGTLDVAWTNPPHRSHLCHGCGHIWRPADVPTNGVAVIATKGSADSPAAAPAPVSGMPDLAARLNEIDRHLAKCRFTERHAARQLVYSMLHDVCGIPSPQAPDTPVAPTKGPLTRCAAGRDGDCTHPECPQLRDSEPKATGRHCPLDTELEDEQ